MNQIRSWLRMTWLSRGMRIGLYCAILLALAALSFYFHYPVLGVLLALSVIGIAAVFYSFVVRPARIPRDAVLLIRLSGTLPEEPQRGIIDQIRGRGFPALTHLRYALEEVREDPAVRAVILEIGGLDNGLATAEELHDLLLSVRHAGKRVISVLDSDFASIRDYLIASAAGEVVVNPDTMIAMLGVSAGGVFLKRALEKLRIQVQTLQWKEYKGAAEALARESMSAPLRESLEAVIADWRHVVSERIAQARGITAQAAEELIGRGFMSAHDARKAGLIDREGYVEDIRAEIDPEGKRRHFVGMGRYLRHAMYTRERQDRHRIALVCGVGPVVAGTPPTAGEFISAETTGAQIDRASRDEDVKAIVFRVNSPGGSAVGSDTVWRAVRAAQSRGKPVVVSMGDVAGSGGYYVAMCADAIVAEPTTLTGSIGVVYAKFDLSRLLGEAGVAIETAKSHPVSDAMSLNRSMSEAELEQLNSVIGQLYANFTAKVSEGRRLGAEATENLARGRIWSGAAAKAHGLIDQVGGMARAIEIAREKAGIPAHEPHEVISYSQARLITALRLSLSSRDSETVSAMAGHALGLPSRWLPALAQLLLRGGVMMITPFIEL
jgi:protease-4